jgi:hypothetical protein
MRRIVVLLLLLPLMACGLFMSGKERALRKSPDYRAGYQDGCNSAAPPGANKREEADKVRDEAAYKANPAYRAGWNKGLNGCSVAASGGRGADPGAGPNSGPIPDMNPGNGGLPRPY